MPFDDQPDPLSDALDYIEKLKSEMFRLQGMRLRNIGPRQKPNEATPN